MRVSLVHNRLAGRGVLSRPQLLRALHSAGHEVVPDGEVVIVAGGDGTVTREAERLVTTRGALLVLPMGTANNVARSLGYEPTERPIEYVLHTLEHHDERDFDVGQSQTRYGRRLFYEGAGVGLFTDALEETLTEADKEPRRAAHVLGQLLAHYAPLRVELELDGKDASDDYWMVDVMNVAHFGPKLHLTPRANPFDGMFDVALVRRHEVAALADYLAALARGEEPSPPVIANRRAQKVRLRLHGKKLRLDGKLHPRREVSGAHRIELDVLKGALRVWLPTKSSSSSSKPS